MELCCILQIEPLCLFEDSTQKLEVKTSTMWKALHKLMLAWRLYKEGNSLNLLDASLGDSCTESEVLRSINIGLLCVQQRAEDRPSMSSVVIMFGGDSSLPPPKQPGFFVEEIVSPTTSLSASSINEVTVAQITGG